MKTLFQTSISGRLSTLPEKRFLINFRDITELSRTQRSRKITNESPNTKGKFKWILTIGMDAFGRILVVVYMWRGDNIRIISARKAERSEVRQYESEL
ncbi:MAG: BrnT family toxin [Spartobacteria bacterium]|nr:BrnT family toxin [Spartobacteria bacterium]